MLEKKIKILIQETITII